MQGKKEFKQRIYYNINLDSLVLKDHFLKRLDKTAVTASPSSLHDTGAVPELLRSHEKILGSPSWIAADTKYGSEECLAYLQGKNIKLL